MVITFSNIKGSAGGGGGATSGEISGITLWSDETTKSYIDNALSGVTDALSAYTKTEDFSTINGSAITSGGNIVIEATPYTAGANIDITDHVISVTGISAPTKVSELVNDAGYVNSGEVETQITDKGYITAYTETDPVFMASAASGISEQDISNWNNKLDSSDLEPYYTSAQTDNAINNAVSGKADSSAVTAQISEVKAQIEAEIPSKVSSLENDLNFVNSGDVKTQIESYNYINSGQAQTQIDNSISGKLNTDIFTAYTANTQTELNNKQDASGMTEYATTAFTENTYAKIGDIPSLDGYATTGWVESQGYLTEHQDISGKLDTNVFTTYTANTQTELSNKQDASGMTEYATTAFTESTYLKEHQSLSAYSTTEQVQTLIDTAKQEVENEIPDVSNFVTSAQVETQITDKGYLTGYTETDPVFMASAASGISAQDITNWNAKLNSSALTPYYTSAQTDNAISNAVSVKADSSRVDEIEEVTASALVELHNTKQDILVSGTNIKTINNQSLLGSGNIEIQGGSGSDYSAGANIDITDNVISVTGITLPTKVSELVNDAGYVNSGEVETQITSKGYLTGYTESDPIFQASAASGISEQDITNWNAKLDSSALTPYYTSAQTDTAIDNATSGKQDTLVSGTNIKTINNQSLLGSGNIQIQGGSGGGSNIIEITQAEYDALTAYTEDAIYVITDSQAINMDNYATTGALGSYYTSAETDTAISNAVSGKTDKISVVPNDYERIFPAWNNQGCITGTSATAYLSSQHINNSYITVYSDSDFPLPTIYAPTSAGSAGQPLLSNGSGAPVWASYKFQFISQSQYDALATKDSTTIYFIIKEN